MQGASACRSGVSGLGRLRQLLQGRWCRQRLAVVGYAEDPLVDGPSAADPTAAGCCVGKGRCWSVGSCQLANSAVLVQACMHVQ